MYVCMYVNLATDFYIYKVEAYVLRCRHLTQNCFFAIVFILNVKCSRACATHFHYSILSIMMKIEHFGGGRVQ